MGIDTTDNEGQEYSPQFAAALGRTIKVLRTDQGIARRELAERAGISYSYLTEIENGNKPPSSTRLGRIALALGLRMHQLIEAAESRVDSQTDALGQAEAPLQTEAPPHTPARSQAPAPVPALSAQEWIRRFGSSGPLRSAVPQARRTPASAQERTAPPSPAWEEATSEPGGGSPAYLRMEVPEETLGSGRPPSPTGRELRATLADLEHLLRTMAPDDIDRLLDYARRLARP